MKKASFSATITSPINSKSSTAYCVVTLKDDNKISISISRRNELSYRLVSKANEIAKEIVASDFNHPSIIGQVESSDSGILSILMSETAQLKSDLMTRTQIWAKNSYAHIVDSIESVREQRDKVIAEYDAARKTDAPKMWLRDVYQKLQSKCIKMSEIANNGVDAYVSKQLKNAEEHYTSSLSKLALKITDKKLNMSNFKLVSGYVGVNLEMRMTDGVESVKAWTIWAAEDSTLVTPHYRYLVK
jgi:hypothetical protein